MLHSHPLAGLTLALASLASSLQAQDTVKQQVAGSDVFKMYCAVCHGKSAQGDGPLADSFRMRPPDLTLLAKKNHGTFPTDQVTRTVDGRKPAKGHGGPDMPVWGDAFKQSHGGYSEEAVKERIHEVVEYVASLQRP
jgi:mono/diheme cytochrome c family protein